MIHCVIIINANGKTNLFLATVGANVNVDVNVCHASLLPLRYNTATLGLI